jgi:hypothetical protein
MSVKQLTRAEIVVARDNAAHGKVSETHPIEMLLKCVSAGQLACPILGRSPTTIRRQERHVVGDLEENPVFFRRMVLEMVEMDKDLTPTRAVGTDSMPTLWLTSKMHKPCVALHRILAGEFARHRASIT